MLFFRKNIGYLFFILNVCFFSIMSISLYKILCRIDLDFFFFFIFHKSYSIFFFLDNVSFLNNVFFFTFYSNDFFSYIIIDDVDLFSCLFIFFDINFSFLDVFSSIRNYSLDSIFTYRYDSILEVKFFTKVQSFHHINFICLQDSIFLINNDTTLVFFRISNLDFIDVSCIVIFLISPSSLIVNLVKLQCFCFDNIYLYPGDVLDLPVLFNIDLSFFYVITKKTNLVFFYLLVEK